MCNQVRGRRGARMAALTSGGAIPELGDYRVLLDPDDTFIGSVNEDFAMESAAGDIFLLGSTSGRIKRVSNSVVRVVDAHGAYRGVQTYKVDNQTEQYLVVTLPQDAVLFSAEVAGKPHIQHRGVARYRAETCHPFLFERPRTRSPSRTG